MRQAALALPGEVINIHPDDTGLVPTQQGRTHLGGEAMPATGQPGAQCLPGGLAEQFARF